ncbi:MAG: DUF4034 domain-containing protein [Alphaproteobacteria bacterium]|nr:DUF4034 domain-containing protein [Alphaproteobacteria bacterium]
MFGLRNHSRPGACGRALIFALLCVILGCPQPANGQPEKPKHPIPGSLELIDQLRKDEFRKLETLLNRLQAAYEAGKIPEETVNSAFAAFMNSGADLKGRLDAWILRFPGSYAALLARGYHTKALGWHARQGAYVKFTDPTQMRRMEQYFARARADFNAALEINPRLTIAYAEMIGIAMALGLDHERVALMAKGLAIDPASPSVHYAYLYTLRPEWGGSFSAMERFVFMTEAKRLLNPKIPNLKESVVRARANRFRLEGKYRDAIGILDKAIADLGHYASFYRLRGACRRALRNFGPALEDLNRALTIDPENPGTLSDRALLYFIQDRHTAGLKDVTLALKYDPRDPGLLRLRADIYRAMKKPEAAIRDLREAMEFGSFDSDVWMTPAKIYAIDMNDPTKAMAYMENMARLRPRHPDTWLGYHSVAMDIGMHLYQHKRDCDGARVFLRFLNSCRDNAVCKKRLWYTAAPIMGSAVAETKCRASAAP